MGGVVAVHLGQNLLTTKELAKATSALIATTICGSRLEAYSMNLKGAQKRAYDFVVHFRELCDLYEVDTEFADCCMIVFDADSHKPVATVYDEEFHIETDDMIDH